MAPAAAQSDFVTFPQRPRPPARPAPPAGAQPQMLVQANEVQYDYTNQRVLAVGNVQIYYNGATVEADKVIYDQKTKHLHAEGNVRLTEADGKITYGEIMNLSDDYRDGFVELAPARHSGPDALRRHARHALRRQFHGVSERSLHRLRGLQGRPKEATAVAGQGRPDHP